MEKEQIVTKLTEVIHDVLPELDEVDMHANMVNEYGVNSVSLIRLLVAACTQRLRFVQRYCSSDSGKISIDWEEQ